MSFPFSNLPLFWPFLSLRPKYTITLSALTCEWTLADKCSERSEGENYWPRWRLSTRLKISVEFPQASSFSDS